MYRLAVHAIAIFQAIELYQPPLPELGVPAILKMNSRALAEPPFNRFKGLFNPSSMTDYVLVLVNPSAHDIQAETHRPSRRGAACQEQVPANKHPAF